MLDFQGLYALYSSLLVQNKLLHPNVPVLYNAHSSRNSGYEAETLLRIEIILV